MTTFAALRTNIADYLNRSDLNTQINTAINRAIAYYAKLNRFWFNETTGTFNTVASQGTYTSSDTSIVTGLTEIDYVKIALSASSNFELTPRTYQYIQDVNVNNSTGQPDSYAFYKQAFYLYPIPNGAYTVTVSYVKNYADLSADADTNDFTDNAQDLIEARALWFIYSRILKNTELATMAKGDEIEALRALQAQTDRKIASGKIMPTSF